MLGRRLSGNRCTCIRTHSRLFISAGVFLAKPATDQTTVANLPGMRTFVDRRYGSKTINSGVQPELKGCLPAGLMGGLSIFAAMMAEERTYRMDMLHTLLCDLPLREAAAVILIFAGRYGSFCVKSPRIWCQSKLSIDI